MLIAALSEMLEPAISPTRGPREDIDRLYTKAHSILTSHERRIAHIETAIEIVPPNGALLRTAIAFRLKPELGDLSVVASRPHQAAAWRQLRTGAGDLPRPERQ